MRKNPNSILLAAIPKERGTPDHFEYEESALIAGGEMVGGMTRRDPVTDQIMEIHTPQTTLHRIHEALHARHTHHENVDMPEVYPVVTQIIEDCRLHLTKWPWQRGHTPRHIQNDIIASLAEEAKVVPSLNRDDAFMCTLRSKAVSMGLSVTPLPSPLDHDDAVLQHELLRDIINGDARRAAQKMQIALFGALLKPALTPQAGDHEGRKIKKGKKPKPIPDYTAKISMQIIDLPKTRPAANIDLGMDYRKATSGGRIIRHALRKPILPQRLFTRRVPQEPEGTILIDASGSMGSIDFVDKVLQTATQATIAYYAGNERTKGWLYIYARDGWRAEKTVEPPHGGNTVDGLALDWLMKERGPRVFITDLGFTGPDAAMQIARAKNLERNGEITIRMY